LAVWNVPEFQSFYRSNDQDNTIRLASCVMWIDPYRRSRFRIGSRKYNAATERRTRGENLVGLSLAQRRPRSETRPRARLYERSEIEPWRIKFKVGEHVTWNSEAGHVSGKIVNVHTKNVNYKGYVHRASDDDPQYEIKSDKTDHVALHRGAALKRVRR
jgi:hypothetical protein